MTASEYPSPENTPETPWAMQLALRVEKVDPPSDIEACETAARACVAFLAEAAEHAGTVEDEAQWWEAVEMWRGIAIRKIVRRARGQRWLDAQELPGVTVTQGQAAARAFVPAPLRPLPPQLGKMQVEGTDLPSGASSTDEAHVIIRISPLLEMTTGKTAAQCAHAAQRAWEVMSADARASWAADGFRVRVERDTPEAWDKRAGQVSIVDAGFTELEGQHETTRANW